MTRGDQIVLLIIQLFDTCIGTPIQIENVDEELIGLILNVLFFVFYEQSLYPEVCEHLTADTLITIIRILSRTIIEDHDDKYEQSNTNHCTAAPTVLEGRKKRRLLYQRILICMIKKCPLQLILSAIGQFIQSDFTDEVGVTNHSKTISSLMKRVYERFQTDIQQSSSLPSAFALEKEKCILFL